jgi:hypothetical protein
VGTAGGGSPVNDEKTGRRLADRYVVVSDLAVSHAKEQPEANSVVGRAAVGSGQPQWRVSSRSSPTSVGDGAAVGLARLLRLGAGPPDFLVSTVAFPRRASLGIFPPAQPPINRPGDLSPAHRRVPKPSSPTGAAGSPRMARNPCFFSLQGVRRAQASQGAAWRPCRGWACQGPRRGPSLPPPWPPHRLSEGTVTSIVQSQGQAG